MPRSSVTSTLYRLISHNQTYGSRHGRHATDQGRGARPRRRRSARKGSGSMIGDKQGLDQDRMIVLSLRPRFAEAIMAGDKTVELRRTEPKIVVPMRALLYATTPVRALLGTCVITSAKSPSTASKRGQTPVCSRRSPSERVPNEEDYCGRARRRCGSRRRLQVDQESWLAWLKRSGSCSQGHRQPRERTNPPERRRRIGAVRRHGNRSVRRRSCRSLRRRTGRSVGQHIVTPANSAD